ncbi:MAG: hypothetical protein ACOYLC_15585, partial [Armatimonadaceae bacterium]
RAGGKLAPTLGEVETFDVVGGVHVLDFILDEDDKARWLEYRESPPARGVTFRAPRAKSQLSPVAIRRSWWQRLFRYN